ncbi:protein FRIGIDA [Mercurialis annua]|uniref:protein FRIGIDA n=1 Tax=Mercurialis annua TaxID=3986 RepID=UPI00215FFEAD|nr:protein FRIGIDA [Mercurialis annua]
MATPALVSVKDEQEHEQSTPTPPQHQPPLRVKSEPHTEDEPLAIVAIQHQQQQPQFFKSIEQLNNLASAITEFHRRFHELNDHLNFIGTAIQQHDHQPIQSDSPSPAKAISQIPTPATVPAPTSSSELVSLCEMMSGKGLRRYLTNNLSNLSKLRSEVPTAIKRSPNPAKLVLECVGGFYLQGSKAYAKNSPMIPGRTASILALELFLLILDDSVKFDADVKQEAEQAAIAWRKRILAEGSVSKASEIDATGLLLFIGCYGIPKVFTSGDVWDLVKLSNSKKISDALKRSHVLVTRVSDILGRMMNSGIKLEAVDVAYTFGIEDKFPPQKLLKSLLRDSKEALKKRERETSNSPALLKEATQKHLATLKSVMKFLERRKLDPKTILPGWEFREKIEKLEKDIADLNKRIDDKVKVAQKRRAEENEFLNKLKSQEAKRPRFSGSTLISSPSFGLHERSVHGSTMISSPSFGLHERSVHVDGNGLYNPSTQTNILDGGISGRINPSAVSMMYGSGSYSAAYGVPSTSSYPGVYRETLGDRSGNIMGSNTSAYGYNGHSSIINGTREQSFVHQPASGLFVSSLSREGYIGDSSMVNGTREQSFVHQSASGLFAPSLSREFTGLPSPTPAGNRSSASDLYSFADAVK